MPSLEGQLRNCPKLIPHRMPHAQHWAPASDKGGPSLNAPQPQELP